MPITRPYDPNLVPADRAGALGRNWGLLALRGVLAIVFGTVAFLLPGVAIASLTLMFGAYMLVDGVVAIMAGLRALARHERWGFLVLEGILGLGAAGFALVYPLPTVLALVTFAAAWAVVSGVALLLAALRMPADGRRWWMGLGAAVSVLWGALLFAFPAGGLLIMTWWLAGYAIAFGIAMLALALRLRSGRA
jgi:uncharacterized membrane protein HdeD (DUF308 family)